MVAWTGIENFRVGRFEPPPPANDPEDYVVCNETCSLCPWLIIARLKWLFGIFFWYITSRHK